MNIRFAIGILKICSIGRVTDLSIFDQTLFTIKTSSLAPEALIFLVESVIPVEILISNEIIFQTF